jgi:hypothetical protein
MAKEPGRKADERPEEPESAPDDALAGDRERPLRPEMAGGAPVFGPHSGRERLAGGGIQRGEALQLSEEEDDFEDGRSSGGLTSRSQDDQWARGDVGSRAVEVRSGVLSVEGLGDTDVVEAARGEEPEAPEDLEGASSERRGIVAGAAETSRSAEPPRFERSPGIPVPDERGAELARNARSQGKTRKTAAKGKGARKGESKRKAPSKKYSQNA